MKKIVPFLLVSIILSSCSLEKIIDELSPDMTANIDGKAWQANAQYTQIESNTFIITGTTINGETLVITTFGTSEDVYELNLGSAGCAAVYKESAESSEDDTYIGATGTVVISSVNTTQKTINGTFTYTVVRGIDDMITISDGQFKDLKYTEGN